MTRGWSLPRLLPILAWVAIGLSAVLIFDSVVFWRYLADETRLSATRLVFAPVSRALLWTALAPLVIWLARRVPPRPPRLWRAVLAHLLLATTLGLGAITLYSLLFVGHGPYEVGWRWTLIWLAEWMPLHAAIVGATHAHDSHFRLLARERLSMELRAKLAEAHLRAFRQQLHPHFVFNTLQAVSTLMYRDVAAADALLGHLSGLLRQLLDLLERREITLAEELAFVDSYLAIERGRLGDRMDVRTVVAPELLACPVPPLVLQPLVENAVKHAIVSRRGGGQIVLGARRLGERLELEVRDDGPGLPPDFGPAQYGTGLRSTHGRLQALGHGCRSLTLENVGEGGLSARVTLPYAGAAAPIWEA